MLCNKNFSGNNILNYFIDTRKSINDVFLSFLNFIIQEGSDNKNGKNDEKNMKIHIFDFRSGTSLTKIA